MATRVLTTVVQCVGMGVLAWALGGCMESISSAAQEKYATDDQCPTAVAVQTGTASVLVTGCGHEEVFSCTPGWPGTKYESGYPTSCSYRERLAYQATDGSLHVDNWDGASPSRDAAIASAAHDLTCAPASITAVDDLTLEGCGQRVTYRQLAFDVPTPPIGEHKITGGERFLLVGRVPLGGAANPAPAAATSSAP